MGSDRATARPRFLEKLAERLATAQNMADSGNYSTAFGYLEEAVQLTLAHLQPPGVIRATSEAGAKPEVELRAYDCADVWRGVESHPLFPDDQ